MTGAGGIRVRVTDAQTVADGIKWLKLQATDGNGLPDFSGGAHTVVTMQDGERSARNPYSLMNSPYDSGAYEITVLRTPNSRGGSIFIHDKVHPGTELTIAYPSNLFPIDRRARKHLLIAGGIGITPFMAMMPQLQREGANFELHYAMRSEAAGAYWSMLQQAYDRRVHTYFDDKGQVLPLAELLDGQPLGTHLYVCGPAGMIDWVLGGATAAGWPSENVHYERFSAPPAGKPFTIDLARSKRSILVGPHQSILEALEAAGVEAPFLCRGGACGQCETAVLSCTSAIQHNDHFLSGAERASNRKIMICMSRLNGGSAVLDL